MSKKKTLNQLREQARINAEREKLSEEYSESKTTDDSEQLLLANLEKILENLALPFPIKVKGKHLSDRFKLLKEAIEHLIILLNFI